MPPSTRLIRHQTFVAFRPLWSVFGTWTSSVKSSVIFIAITEFRYWSFGPKKKKTTEITMSPDRNILQQSTCISISVISDHVYILSTLYLHFINGQKCVIPPEINFVSTYYIFLINLIQFYFFYFSPVKAPIK